MLSHLSTLMTACMTESVINKMLSLSVLQTNASPISWYKIGDNYRQQSWTTCYCKCGIMRVASNPCKDLQHHDDSVWTWLQNFQDIPETIHFNPLNAELNPICHLLALLGGATIVVVSRLRVKV
jgi:hypothetical protein